MYTEKERDELLETVTQYLYGSDAFEGLVQMGSGAEGFRDIYSDIDLMAGCRDAAAAGEMLHAFFTRLEAVYIDRRRWSDLVLGLSAYWENGLSLDISFMPTEQIPVLSARIAIVFSKSEVFTRHIQKGIREYRPPVPGQTVQHSFFYALRRCEIALLRGEYIYADMALGEARAVLLRLAAGRDGDPKRYNELDPAFLEALEGTYPTARTREAVAQAKEHLLALYLRTAGTDTDPAQRKLIGCFE